uniref:Hes-related family bHLH transcription factor with YRPW motif 2 n=1 Tax=Gasterosteus aculeatus aculeatus TaxID=481459 RepID=A0AAQ4RMP6_GASAC|nr:hairy/enhancer-of-split related with YRPW motif protein 2 isoform X2 [Gasterosteus aculeatus aculeatus]
MKRPREDRAPGTGPPGHTKASFIRCASPPSTPQVMARKRRRGVIEKRRRDRINSSLLELRGLVPQQGSAKLEKAEILQMTVDHLKVLQATGGKGHVDARPLALDFLSVGFRECVTEVSRYLSAVEGVASGDPLRCRLISHLAYCCSQRDAAALAIASRFPLQQHHPLPHPVHPVHWAFGPLPSYTPSASPVSPDSGGGRAPQRPGELVQRVASSFSTQADSTSSPPSSLTLPCAPLSAPLLHGGYPIIPPCSSSSSSSSSSLSSKPFRPWGAEVGAF